MKKNNIQNHTIFAMFIVLGFVIIYTMKNKRHDRFINKPTIISNREIITYVPEPSRRINIPTRGDLPAYKNVGFIANNKADHEVLSLYGRPTYRGSQNWNYYTMHEGVRVPIENCERSRGCQEKMNGDSVNIDSLGSQYKINVYEHDAPRYIPY